MNEYDVVEVVSGVYGDKQLRVAQWAIRDSKVLAEARLAAGSVVTLTVERYDAHPELEGERVISSSETSRLPLYYQVAGR